MKNTCNIILICLVFLSNQLFAQAGMTVSPGKVYYKLTAGAAATKKVLVSNPNSKDLEIGVSINDWDYDQFGNNQTHDAGTLKTSCADWIQVLPGSYFTLKPGEQRELSIVFQVPANADTSIAVHTAMIFFTQLNPGDSRAQDGTMIKVSVRMGVKLYHTFSQAEERSIEVLNFIDKPDPAHKELPGFLELQLENNGKIWLETKIKWELLNTQTGEKQKLNDQESYSLPGDKRIIQLTLPPNLKRGHYNATAIINYGNKDELKVVELEFEH